MSSVKPDTSLYAELPDRIRAFLLVDELADAGKTIQVSSSQGWLSIERDKNRFCCRLENIMDCDNHIDYRIAPEPPKPSDLLDILKAVVANANGDGKSGYYDIPVSTIKDAKDTIARFVEDVNYSAGAQP